MLTITLHSWIGEPLGTHLNIETVEIGEGALTIAQDSAAQVRWPESESSCCRRGRRVPQRASQSSNWCVPCWAPEDLLPTYGLQKEFAEMQSGQAVWCLYFPQNLSGVYQGTHMMTFNPGLVLPVLLWERKRGPWESTHGGTDSLWVVLRCRSCGDQPQWRQCTFTLLAEVASAQSFSPFI